MLPASLTLIAGFSMRLHDYYRSSAAYRLRIALNLKVIVPTIDGHLDKRIFFASEVDHDQDNATQGVLAEAILGGLHHDYRWAA